MSQQHTGKHQSQQSHLNANLNLNGCPGMGQCPDNHLIEAFTHGLSLLSQDSLLSVFRDNKDSRQFMFDRIREILEGCVKTAKHGAEMLYADARSEQSPPNNRQFEQLREENQRLCTKVLELTDQLRQATQNQAGYQTNGSAGDDTRELNSLLGIKHPAALAEEKLVLERQLREVKMQCVQLTETIRMAAENEKTLKVKLEAKSKGLEEMRERVGVADREAKKAIFEKRECEEVLSRKAKLLEEENTILRQKFADLMTGSERSAHHSETASALKSAEQKTIEYREQARLLQRKFEESEFNAEQSRISAQTLKQEIQHLNELVKSARNSAYHLEVQLIESRDRESESKLQTSNLDSTVSKLTQELNIAQSNLKSIEEKHRTEKKRAMELERMNEQLSFTSGRQNLI